MYTPGIPICDGRVIVYGSSALYWKNAEGHSLISGARTVQVVFEEVLEPTIRDRIIVLPANIPGGYDIHLTDFGAFVKIGGTIFMIDVSAATPLIETYLGSWLCS